jgi:ribosomal protein S12 methylthiotransferase
MDIALQHISNPMLKAMRRNITKEETYALVRSFREQVPGITLRTTLIAGHPDETDEDFQELIQFVKDIRFEKLGIFTYSHEENTYAWNNYNDNIPEEIKQQRADEIMSIQRQISEERNQKLVGKDFKVIIDRREGDYYIGRTEFDSPEVDGEVLIATTKRLVVGNFKQVMITDADEYDLFAKLI